MGHHGLQEGKRDLEKGQGPTPKIFLKSLSLPEPACSASPTASATSTPTLVFSNSGKALVVSTSGKALVLSNSGKRIDQAGKKKYVKQVTGRHNDTELHLAVQRGASWCNHSFKLPF